MLSNKFYASRSESFYFLSAWKTQSPFLLECFSLFPCFSLGLQLWRRHMLTHPSHLRAFLPSVSLPLSAAFWVTFPGGENERPSFTMDCFPMCLAIWCRDIGLLSVSRNPRDLNWDLSFPDNLCLLTLLEPCSKVCGSCLTRDPKQSFVFSIGVVLPTHTFFSL